MFRLLVIVGSLRAASASKALARTLVNRLGPEVDVSYADIGGLPHYNADLTDNEAVGAFVEQIRAADGLLFVTPEYNFSVPGVLKNAIDWASRPAYQSVFVEKPAMVISVSGGALGGVRAQGHLKTILNAMLARVFVCQEIVVPLANERTVDGRFVHEATLEFALPKLHQFLVESSRASAR